MLTRHDELRYKELIDALEYDLNDVKQQLAYSNEENEALKHDCSFFHILVYTFAFLWVITMFILLIFIQ